MTISSKRDFLKIELLNILEDLTPETEGNFGLMTPQHMVEHLTLTIKTTAKEYSGQRENPPTRGQLGFQKFIKNGSALQHKPSDKTKADLQPLKYNSLAEAVSHMPEAIQRFYAFWDANPDHSPYSSFMGEVSFEDIELFHYMHLRFHFWQFGLIEKYP